MRDRRIFIPPETSTKLHRVKNRLMSAQLLDAHSNALGYSEGKSI
jgi:hypothetical protein